MSRRSPADLFFKPSSTDETTPGTAAVLWAPQPTFGPFIRRLREATGLSLRKVAADLQMSPAYLSRLETGARASPPSMALLQRIAHVYGADLRELIHEAGFRSEPSPALDLMMEDPVVERFRRLVLHPSLRPVRMDQRAIDFIPDVVQRQWIEFALRVEAAVLAGADINSIVMGLSAPPDESSVGELIALEGPHPQRPKRGINEVAANPLIGTTTLGEKLHSAPGGPVRGLDMLAGLEAPPKTRSQTPDTR